MHDPTEIPETLLFRGPKDPGPVKGLVLKVIYTEFTYQQLTDLDTPVTSRSARASPCTKAAAPSMATAAMWDRWEFPHIQKLAIPGNNSNYNCCQRTTATRNLLGNLKTKFCTSICFYLLK